jgi:hypothetical protein
MNTKRILRSLSWVTVLALLLLGSATTTASADSGSASYDYLIGTALCSDPECIAVARAANGDTIEIAGAGTLSIHPKSVSGGGTFTHHFAGGGSGSGTWTATKLLSFDEFHCFFDPGLGDICGGRVLIRVHLVAAGGSTQSDAILEMTCILGGKAPASAVEGIRLAIQGGPNFNNELGGLDLFIKQ